VQTAGRHRGQVQTAGAGFLPLSPAPATYSCHLLLSPAPVTCSCHLLLLLSVSIETADPIRNQKSIATSASP
jgi:hypothetical protein